MKRHIVVLDRAESAAAHPSKPMDFEWDPETGELSGRDAERIRARAAETGAYFLAWDADHIPIVDPLHRVGEMAAMLLRDGFQPPDWMLAELPEPVSVPYSGEEGDMDGP